MVDLKILEGLTFHGSENFLFESGYIQEDYMIEKSEECDAVLLYPYLLYSEDHIIIDRICHAEYCMIDEDGEYEDFKSKWIRT